MTRYNIILLLVAMIGSGVLGGAANYLLLHKDDPEYAKRSRSFVLGLVASLLAPLFLKTISSDMVDKISTIRYGSGIPFDFFVFASFCLLAAVFSRTFAETVAKRLAAEVEKAKRESQEAQTRAALAEERASQVEPVLRQEMEAAHRTPARIRAEQHSPFTSGPSRRSYRPGTSEGAAQWAVFLSDGQQPCRRGPDGRIRCGKALGKNARAGAWPAKRPRLRAICGSSRIKAATGSKPKRPATKCPATAT